VEHAKTMSASTGETAAPRSGAEVVRRRASATSRQAQEIWFALARTEWTSLAIVPVDDGQDAADVAKALAEVGSRVRESPVRAFTTEPSALESSIDIGVAAKLAASGALERQAGAARAAAPRAQVIFAVQPILREPLGMAVLQAVDAVLLCVQLGRTRLDAVQRLVEVIGRERVVGCLKMVATPRRRGSR
jgi:hypothetical protein